MDNFFGEMKRRNVFRVAGVYAVVGWVLTQIATTLEQTMSLPVWFDGLIVALLLVGFPIALVFAWAFELTAAGMMRTADVPEDQSITSDTGRKLDVAIIVGLALLAVMIVWQQLGTAPQPAEVEATTEQIAADISDASIAVLPFTDLSPEGDQEYFSDGIAEEILNVLVGVDGLVVTSRTSSFQFKDRGLGIPEIAAELNVRHVVEGSVRKSGETIRVTAQLIDSRIDKHLWSGTYDRPLTAENIFEIQDEIASSIVAALSDTLGVGRLEPIQVTTTTRNLSAYELYLRVRPMFHSRTDLDVADELIARAVELDSQFAKAWEIRAALQPLAREYGYSGASVEESEERADEFARRALEIEPRSATALAVLAKVDGERAAELRGDINVSRVIDDLSRALEIEPRNASALNWRGLRYLMVGDLESASADFTICMEYEPYYRPCIENYYSVLSMMGKDEESILAFLDALSKGSARNEFAYLPVLVRLGNELAFKIVTNDHFLLQGWHRHDELWDAYNNPDDNHGDLIESMRGYLEGREGGYINAFSYLAHPIGIGWRIPDSLVIWDPMMSVYRQTEPFKNYMRESGVLDYWLKAGFPPQCRPLGEDDFECD